MDEWTVKYVPRNYSALSSDRGGVNTVESSCQYGHRATQDYKVFEEHDIVQEIYDRAHKRVSESYDREKFNATPFIVETEHILASHKSILKDVNIGCDRKIKSNSGSCSIAEFLKRFNATSHPDSNEDQLTRGKPSNYLPSTTYKILSLKLKFDLLKDRMVSLPVIQLLTSVNERSFLNLTDYS